MRVVALFTRAGQHVANVTVPADATIVTHEGLYYRLESGRFVESVMFVAVGGAV